MNRKVAKQYIYQLSSKLDWASQYVPVSKFGHFDWGAGDEVYKARINNLVEEAGRIDNHLAELALDLELQGKREERAAVVKVMQVLAKYVDKDDGT